MPQGVIVKAISGFYYVLPTNKHFNSNEFIQCRGKGIFRKNEQNPIVGDHVLFEFSGTQEGTVTELLPRVNELTRPPIANVDLAVLVFSVEEPKLNLQLIDKYLIVLEEAKVPCLICLTKVDLLSSYSEQNERLELSLTKEIAEYVSLYRSLSYEIFLTSTRRSYNLDWLRNRLKDQISLFFGQSGVGKSSLLNLLNSGLNLETNSISMKLGRGKHTTRHIELYPLETGGLVADTPGFSQLDLHDIELEELASYFREFAAIQSLCKFRGCSHVNEPDCQVKKAVNEGRIAQSRYQHYTLFIQEIKQRKKRY